MKSITAFRQEDYGFFIDLEDKPASVAVHPSTGDILLDEGEGDDRFHGAALSARSFRGFELREVTCGRFHVQVQFGRNQTHLLGGTADRAGAARWILEATRAIESARRSAGEPPLPVASQSISLTGLPELPANAEPAGSEEGTT